MLDFPSFMAMKSSQGHSTYLWDQLVATKLTRYIALKAGGLIGILTLALCNPYNYNHLYYI